MTIEETYKLLETEKFCRAFNNLSLQSRLTLLSLRKVFSLSFNIPENELYTYDVNTLFFIKYLHRKRPIDIDSIKLDIINKVDTLVIALKYFEPLEVIEEIKLRLRETNIILSNKIYYPPEVAEIFGIAVGSIMANPIFIKLRTLDSDGNSKKLFWTGKDLIVNYEEIIKHSRSLNVFIDGVKYVPLTKLINFLAKEVNIHLDRDFNKNKIFGVEIEYKRNGAGRSSYIKESLYKEVVNNKKYYIPTKHVKDLIKDVHGKNLTTVSNYYFLYYGKIFKSELAFCKKETASRILEIHKLKDENYKLYIDKLYATIEQSESVVFNLTKVMSAMDILSRRTHTINKLKLTSNDLSKNEILEIMKYLNERTKRYQILSITT